MVVPEDHEPRERSTASRSSESPGASHGEDGSALEFHEQGDTAPIELPTPASVPLLAPAADAPGQIVARPASAHQQEVLFVPLAVSIGDGFKFGCGFFLALVLVMLLGFVVLAALFALTSVFGLNLPITR